MTLTSTNKEMISAVDVKQFYDEIQFPGHYTMTGLEYHVPDVRNPYLKIIDAAMHGSSRVLDVGCGTGLIANLFAKRYPDTHITGIDFADSIRYAVDFAARSDIPNVRFIQQDFLDYRCAEKYDLVVCQGVLHHMPRHDRALAKIKSLLTPTGSLVIGLYHPWGKMLKKYIDIDYQDPILYRDQEHNKYEIAFSMNQVHDMLPEFDLKDQYPPQQGLAGKLRACFNYRNGGLITYFFQRNSNENI